MAGNSQWKKGMASLNPGGRPAYAKLLRRFALEHSEEAMQRILDLMNDPDVPAAVQLACAKEILDRGLGKSREFIEIEHTRSLREVDAARLEAFIAGKIAVAPTVTDITPPEEIPSLALVAKVPDDDRR